MTDSNAGSRPRSGRLAPAGAGETAGPGGGLSRQQQLVARLAAQARVRRKMAEQMARDLAFPPDRRPGTVSEFVQAKSMYVKFESTDEVLLAFPDAPRMVAMGSPRSVGYFEGPGGLVLYFHDTYELWDLVLPVEPFRDFVLLGVEDVEDVFFMLTADSAKAISAFAELVDEVNQALPQRADMVRRGLLPPLQRGFSVPASSSSPASAEPSS